MMMIMMVMMMMMIMIIIIIIINPFTRYKNNECDSFEISVFINILLCSLWCA